MTDGTDPSAADIARAYYEAIDATEFERFADLLGSGVVHERPDRTIEGRETLVGFMRDDRPNKDTAHEIEAVYVEDRDTGETGARETGMEETGTRETGTGETSAEVAVRGRLCDADGDPMFGFVDAFEVEEGEISRIRTYTN